MRCSAGVGAMWCGCAAPLLAHVNLLLTLYGGATLATAARLKWDPSTYIAVRELFPVEYRAAAATTALYGATLLLLAHLAATALHLNKHSTRRVLLYVYAAVMTALVVGELVFGAWLTRRVLAWLHSDAALQLQEAMELRQYLKPLLQYFSRWHPLPQRIEALIQEAEEDLPRNAYVAAALVVLLALLQPLAVLLALCAARRPPPPAYSDTDGRSTSPDESTALAKRSYSGRQWRGAAARCVTYVVRIYYTEKARSGRLTAG